MELNVILPEGLRVNYRDMNEKIVKKSYVIISPCRNEENYMRQTLNSVVNQSILPSKWVIVDDGSTDSTPLILEEYAAKYEFIQIVTRTDRGHRSVGPGVIEAFYVGYNEIDVDDYRYICKLDLDLNLPKLYFENLIVKMESEPRLGTYSGKPYFIDKQTRKHIPEVCGDESSIGASKFYRVTCFKQIGGFVRQVMWDGIDSHRCRYLGWISASEDKENIRFIHLRPMGSSQKSILTGRVRHGFGQYYMGTSFIYMFASFLYRLNKKPYIVGAFANLWGYVKSMLIRVEKLNDPDMVRIMRAFQWDCLYKGKRIAIDKINSSRESVWDPTISKYKIPRLEC